MALISLREISVRFGGPEVLEQVSLSIEPGDRACVTGRNGEGKSTLLKIIAGLIPPDSGDILRQPGVKVSYLPQDVPAEMDGTVAEIVERNLPSGMRDGHHPGAAPLLTQLSLDGNAPFACLSGGQRRRVMIACALVCDPHVLLLDEPTNHLDIECIEWLEGYLKKSRCACLFVTHDRAFLKSVAAKVLDLDRGRLAGWDCDYATFLRRKRELLNDEAVNWERKGKKLAQEEAWIRRGVKARTTRNEGRVAALLKMREEFSRRRLSSGVSNLRLNSGEASGELVLKTDGVGFAYPGGQPLVSGLSVKVLRGERVGIIGPNGSGKTTLLNLLCGILKPTEGSLRIGANVKLVFFDQLRGQLDLDGTVADNLAEGREEIVIGGTRKHVFGYLQDFLFTPDRARMPVRALSGGERARLLLAKLFVRPGNLLVMDEPTNDLDIETLELLEEQLTDYEGTLLLVSHDRDFLDNVVTGTFVLEGGGKVGVYPGGYADCLRQRTAAAEEPAKAGCGGRCGPREARKRRDGGRLGFNEKRERLELPERIHRLEQETKTLQAALCDVALYQREPDKAAETRARLAAAEKELESAFERWVWLEERHAFQGA